MQDTTEDDRNDPAPPAAEKRLSPAEVIAIALSLLWLVGGSAFFLFAGPVNDSGQPRGTFLMTLVAIFVPIALIWMVALGTRAHRELRAETSQLREELAELRFGILGASGTAARRPTQVDELDRVKIPEPRTKVAFSSRRDGGEEGEASDDPFAIPPRRDDGKVDIPPPRFGKHRKEPTFSHMPARPRHTPPADEPAAHAAPEDAPADIAAEQEPPYETPLAEPEEVAEAPFVHEVPEEDEQTAFALDLPETPAAIGVSNEVFIRAVNFPTDPQDKPGFDALRQALKDPMGKDIIQAAQDVLTLLSKEGIYMDDLAPAPTDPAVWRSFAEGRRGHQLRNLAAITDEASLEVTAERMRSDQVFRDTAHHFLRRFDKVFTAFAPGASDEEIAAFAETRSARAFMLIGHVAGTFDRIDDSVLEDYEEPAE